MSTKLASILWISLLLVINGCNSSGGSNSSSNHSPPLETNPIESEPAVDVFEETTGVQIETMKFSFKPPSTVLSQNTLEIKVVDVKNPSAILSASIGTIRGQNDIVDWTPLPSKSAIFQNLNIESSREYFVNVRSVLNGELLSTSSRSFKKFLPEETQWSRSNIEFTGANHRTFHSSLVAGDKLIYWGGMQSNAINTGHVFHISENKWTNVSTVNAPSPRNNSSAVWTGTEMIIWGGRGNTPTPHYANGGIYNPATDTWRPISSEGAPAILKHTAIWDGSRMVVWGGENEIGGIYNPVTDKWDLFSIPGHIPWMGYAFVWTGQNYLAISHFPNGVSGHVLDNNLNIVKSIPTTRRRHNFKSVWTGTELIIWGGNEQNTTLTTGDAYNPITNKWRAISNLNAPTRREDFTASWIGGEMLIVGGRYNYDYTTENIYAYNPTTDSWRKIIATNENERLYNHSALAVRHDLFIFGAGSSTKPFKISPANALVTCGCSTSQSSCYSADFKSTYARHVGIALTDHGEQIVYTLNPKGVKLWKDAYTNRVLDPRGSCKWNVNEIGNIGLDFNRITEHNCESPNDLTKPCSLKYSVAPEGINY